MKKRLTIFTPTYNRAYILPKLYESLCCQTCQDFEWLIVDDGSSDSTHELVDGWILEAKIAIRYFYQANSGKMRATNYAMKMASSELFVCVDSDDELANADAVKDSLDFWSNREKIAKCLNSNYKLCGMISRKKNPFLKSPDNLGLPFIGTCIDIDMTYKEESTIFVKTDIIRMFPYPEFEGEKFITDIYIYEAISEFYSFLYHPYYFQIIEYQKNGYTNSFRKLLLTNPQGHRAYHLLCLRLGRGNKLKRIINYISLSLFVRDHTMFSASPDRWLTIILYPFGCLKHVYDRYMLWKEK